MEKKKLEKKKKIAAQVTFMKCSDKQSIKSCPNLRHTDVQGSVQDDMIRLCIIVIFLHFACVKQDIQMTLVRLIRSGQILIISEATVLCYPCQPLFVLNVCMNIPTTKEEMNDLREKRKL